VQSTHERLAKGEAVRAGTHLAQMLRKGGQENVRDIRKWLRLEVGPAEQETAAPTRREPSAATGLLQMREEMELFHDGENRGYATVPVSGHLETWPIRSREFSLYLRRQHFGNARSALSGDALQNAIESFEAEAIFNAPRFTVHVRVAASGGAYFLDLADENWGAVEIAASGWRVIPNPPVKFLRPRGLLALPSPTPGGTLTELRSFVNVADESDWVLVLSWLLAAFRPIGPYPVLALYGEHGSAKSTTARVLRSLVDPNRSALRAAPRDTHELMIQANNAHLLCLDNLSSVPQTLSDALSRLATGGGFSVRELYTNDGEMLFDAQRPILLNGIEDLCTRPDLLDRALAIMLPPIPDIQRHPEQHFWERFEAARPRILGALLGAVAAGVRALPAVKLARSPRMADFARWGAALEPGMGLAVGSFLVAYSADRQGANSLALESAPVAVALARFMENRDEWEGTAAELLRELDAVEGENARGKGWPANARTLGNALRRLAPNLRADGLALEFSKASGRARGRMIRARKPGGFASEMPATSEPRQIAVPSADDADANQWKSDASAGAVNATPLCPADVSDGADAKPRPHAQDVHGQRSQNPPDVGIWEDI
jgi:hypothetical protein